jgi:hypothetical protein
MGGFLAAIEPVNRLAEASPGFVWRLRSGESHGAVLVSQDGQPLLVNLSVWESYEALHAFVYRTLHGGFIRRRSRWFEPVPPPATALWWLGGEAGQHPTLEEALRRLRHLRAHGPTPQAFTVRRRFSPDGRAVGRRDLSRRSAPAVRQPAHGGTP